MFLQQLLSRVNRRVVCERIRCGDNTGSNLGFVVQAESGEAAPNSRVQLLWPRLDDGRDCELPEKNSL